MATSSQNLSAEVLADYHQFYLWDKSVSPDAPEDWTEQDVANRLKVAPNIVVVCPERNTKVPVTVEVCTSEPEFQIEEWDHVAECSLDLPSGKLELHECTGGSVGVLEVAPGNYRVRAHFGGLDSLSADGLSGEDHYLIVLWPSRSGPLNVIKQR